MWSLLLVGGFKPFSAVGRLTNVVNRDYRMGVVTQLQVTLGAGVTARTLNRLDRTVRHGPSPEQLPFARSPSTFEIQDFTI